MRNFVIATCILLLLILGGVLVAHRQRETRMGGDPSSPDSPSTASPAVAPEDSGPVRPSAAVEAAGGTIPSGVPLVSGEVAPPASQTNRRIPAPGSKIQPDAVSITSSADVAGVDTQAAHSTGSSFAAASPVSPSVEQSAAFNAAPASPPASTPAADTPAPTAAASADAAYFAELDRIAQMGADLSRADIEALYHLLAQPSHPILGQVEFHAVKTQVLDKLLDQRPLPSDLGQTLVDLFRDRRHDELLRNYSLQHFEPYLRILCETQGTGSQEQVDAVLSAYRSALGESRNSIAGVALLGLERATASDAPLAGHPDRALALRTAIRLVSDPTCDPRSRLSAVQVCAVAGETSAQPTIRALAANPDATTALRIAALHALGELGTASDLIFLRSVSTTASPHIARAASSAASRLQERFGLQE